jgi:probable F420-dependent oxidoreductase
MKFAINYSTPFYGTDPDRIAAYAAHAEACGFEAFYLPDHVVLYPGAAFGAAEIPPTLPFLDPLDVLSFVAASTERIVLGTGVLLLPHRNPVILAKRLATVDVLSKGRMRLLTVGIGSLAGEAAGVGLDFTTRGRRADEAIDVLRLLWSGDEEGVSYHGDFYDFDRLCSYPKPLGGAQLPIHVGGSSLAAARRAGRRGDGYFPGGMLSRQDRATQMDLARAAAAEAGRDPAALEFTCWGSIEMTVEQAETLAGQGMTRVVVAPTSTDPAEQHEQMSAFAERFGLLADSAG